MLQGKNLLLLWQKKCQINYFKLNAWNVLSTSNDFFSLGFLSLNQICSFFKVFSRNGYSKVRICHLQHWHNFQIRLNISSQSKDSPSFSWIYSNNFISSSKLVNHTQFKQVTFAYKDLKRAEIYYPICIWTFVGVFLFLYFHSTIYTDKRWMGESEKVQKMCRRNIGMVP